MEYSSAVTRNFEAARAVLEQPADEPGWVSGEAEDRSLQVWVRFELQVQAGIVRHTRFRVFGCPHAIAAAHLVAKWLKGRTVEEAQRLDIRALCAELDVPTEKLGKLLRIEDAIEGCWAGLSLQEIRD